MRHSKWPIAVVTGCALALTGAPTLGQSQDQTAGQGQDQNAAVCAGEITNADASIEACTRLLDQETRESARRRAAALTFRAIAWRAKGDVKRAVGDLTEAVGLDASFAPAYEVRGDLLRDNDQCDLAIPEYDQVIKLNPERAL